MSKTVSGSCSSRNEVTNDANDVDVEAISVEDEKDLVALRTKRIGKTNQMSQQRNFCWLENQ